MPVRAYAFTAPDLSFTAPSVPLYFCKKWATRRPPKSFASPARESKTKIADGVGDKQQNSGDGDHEGYSE
jgi:hypothetical protein